MHAACINYTIISNIYDVYVKLLFSESTCVCVFVCVARVCTSGFATSNAMGMRW